MDDLDSEICRCHKNGLTREETFQHLCHEHYLPSVAMDQLTQWFKSSAEPATLRENLDRRHFDLLQRINLMFGKIQSTVSIWPYIVDNLICLLNERYALAVCQVGSKMKLHLLDTFHGQMKQIRVTGSVPKQLCFRDMRVIDSKYLLFNDKDSCNIYLMRLDLHNLKCTFLDKKAVRFSYRKLITGYKNQHQFVLIYFDHMIRFQIQSEKLTSKQRFEFGHQLIMLRYERLDDDRLQIITIDGQNMEVGEHSLAADDQYPAYQRLCNFEITVNIGGLQSGAHLWHDNVCYISRRAVQNSQLFILDLDTRKLCQINADFSCHDRCFDMNLGDDGNVLTFCTKDDHGEHFVQRAILRQPEKLTNLAVFKLRRDAIFYGSEIYDSVVAKFPKNLQPFSMSNSGQE